MKIYLATWLQEPNQGVSLTRKKARKRLVSYHLYNELKKQKSFFKKLFYMYVYSGKVKLKKEKK